MYCRSVSSSSFLMIIPRRFVLRQFFFRSCDSAHDKTYNKTYVTSKDSDQSVHSPCLTRALVHPSLYSLEAVEFSCDQRRLWSDYADAQAYLSRRWSPKSYCRFFVRWLIFRLLQMRCFVIILHFNSFQCLWKDLLCHSDLTWVISLFSNFTSYRHHIFLIYFWSLFFN